MITTNLNCIKVKTVFHSPAVKRDDGKKNCPLDTSHFFPSKQSTAEF